MSRTSCRIYAILFTLITACECLTAQGASTGAIRGAVIDSSGGRIPQATIVVLSSATGTRYSSVSDAEGRFGFEMLPPGDYSARAEAQGMSPQITPQIHVDVGGAAEIEFRLAIAGRRKM
jgi:hypothetical protein